MFLDNVSLGFYANMVRDPNYRRWRLLVARHYARRAVRGRGGSVELRSAVPGRVPVAPELLSVLVSNNAYALGLATGGGLRPRLDQGELWVYAIAVPHSRRGRGHIVVDTFRLLAGGHLPVSAWPTAHQLFRTDPRRVPAAVDGEATDLAGPIELASCPGALRLLGPGPPPGVRDMVARLRT